MKHLDYTVPAPYRADRACMLKYNDVYICKLIECINIYEGDKGYIFVPDWEEMDRALAMGMVDISGIDHTLRLKQYNRFNRGLPAFLYFRFIPIDRPDWQFHYAKVGLKHNQDQWEFMIRHHGACAEDPIRLDRCDI